MRIRNNIGWKKAHGEKQNADAPAAQVFIDEKLPQILEKYDPSDIFNCDEIGLYWRGVPDQDADAPVVVELTDLEILEVTKQAKQARLEEDVDESDEELEPEPPLTELLSSLTNLRKFNQKKCFIFSYPELTSHH